MGKAVDGAYTSLIQGVSQQAPIDRLDGQHEEVLNMSCDPEKGLLRRPPTDLVNTLGAVGIYKDIEIEGVPYLLCVTEGEVRGYTLDGIEVPVVGTDTAKKYLQGTNTFGVLSTQDYVYISNPTKIVQMTDDVAMNNNSRAIVHLIGGQYGRRYEVELLYNGSVVKAEHTTPDGSTSAHGAMIATDYIAEKLTAAFTTAVQAAGGHFSIERNSDVLLITYTGTTTLTNFSITANDGEGGVNIFAFTDTLGSSGELSRFAPHGYTVRITGSESSYADDWYLRFEKSVPSDNLVGSGVWVETAKPGAQINFDTATLPHVIRVIDGKLSIEAGKWSPRRVGDDRTNPIPDFVGKAIEDLTVFQGRLVFLSGSNVIMSRTSKQLDFWKNSAVTLVDDDPISVSSATTRSAPIMKKAVPHNRDLVIFSETAQFIIFGRNAITPRNTSLVLTTTYGANLTASPVSGGKNIFYAVDLGGFTGVKEFYTEGDADANASRPITSHCTRYIAGRAEVMQTSANFDLVLVQTSLSKKDLYVYEYIWIDNQKLQSAWSTWRFTEDIQAVIFLNDTIYFVTSFNGIGRLLKMSLDRAWDTKDFQVHLDNKMKIHSVDTTIRIPNQVVTLPNLRFVQGTGCPEEGLEVPVFDIVNGTVNLHYSMGGGTVIVGTEYLSQVTLTPPVVRDRQGESITTGSLSVHHFTVSAVSSGYITGVSTSQYAEPRIQQHDARILSSPLSKLGTPAIGDFNVVFPFMSDVTKTKFSLRTSRHTPLRIIQITWKGDYVKTGTHI